LGINPEGELLQKLLQNFCKVACRNLVDGAQRKRQLGTGLHCITRGPGPEFSETSNNADHDPKTPKNFAQNPKSLSL
ncbi:MAG: hypothetical protein ACK56I_07730, partial [bacterium]